MKYVVISPVRNEGKFIGQTLESISAQTQRPAQWVIVNDGSTDDTGVLADRFAAAAPWLTVVHAEDRGFRKSGGGVVEAFNLGLARISVEDWDVLVKLDGDLEFAPDFFERCLAMFEHDPRLGIGGGLVVQISNGTLVPDSSDDPPFHVRGATKMYRRQCWEEIGGLVQQTGWDTLDEFKANMLGWKTRTFADISLIHLKGTGAADGSWKNAVKNGLGSYKTGYHPLFLLGRCLKRIAGPPPLVNAAGLLYGYVAGWARGVPKAAEPDVIRYVKNQQLRHLFRRDSIYRGER